MPDRLAILTSHPIQYYAPLFREIARRIDVKVFFAHAATAKQQGEAGFGVAFDWDLDVLDGYPHEFLRNVASDPSAQHFFGCDTPEIGEKLAAGRFTALLVTGWHLKSYWQGIRGAKRYDIPVMVRGDSHLGNSTGPGKRLVKGAAYPFLLRLFDAALYVGQRNRAYYERYRYPEERLFHSPHCVDTARFSGGAGPESRAALRARLGIGADVKCVLFAGKLINFKRPLDVIDAAALARAKRHHPVHVIVAGSGPLEAAVEVRAKALNVPIHLLGFQNQTQMPAAYAAADVLVLPSGRETWGLVCNEALACGTPIIVSDAVGCAPDLAADGVAGRTFPVGDVRALAEVIAATLCAPPPAEAIRQVSASHGLPSAVAGITAALRQLPRRSDQPRSAPVSLAYIPGPTIGQRLCRWAGHLPIPKVKGLLSRLPAFKETIPRYFTVQFAGLKYRGRLDQHIDRHIYFFGGYSPAELDFLRRAAQILRRQRGALTFVDVGANVGQHSLYLARHADRIIAFEPNNEVADQFEANLRLNEIKNVEVLRFALGHEDGTGNLGSGFAGNSGSRSLTWSLDETKNNVVKVRWAESAMRDLGVERIDLLKIDVEGYERNVLAGLAETLQRDRPAILFELVGKDVKGGFRSEVELREVLYEDHRLFTLVGQHKAALAEFDWECEEVVCVPREIMESFLC